MRGAQAHSKVATSPSVVPDAGGDVLVKERPGNGKHHRSHQIGSNNVYNHCPKDPNSDACKRTKSTRLRCKTKPKTRPDGTAQSTEFGGLITEDHKVLNAGTESR